MPVKTPPRNIRFVSDSRGKLTDLIVPIEVWREIERRLDPPAEDWPNELTRQRILQAIKREKSIPLDKILKKLGVTLESLDAVDSRSSER